jgi:hypothetical protein
MNKPQRIYRDILKNYWRELSPIITGRFILTRPFEATTETIGDETKMTVTIWYHTDERSVKASKHEINLNRMRWRQLTKRVMSLFVVTRWPDAEVETIGEESKMTVTIWYPAETDGASINEARQSDDSALKSVLPSNEESRDV